MADSAIYVLVVEDEGALLRFIGNVLETRGLKPLLASSVQDGASLLQDHAGKVDLAIVDMVMPGRSGLDLAAEIQQTYPETPILYISGYVDSIAMEVIARRSPESVLLKPFDGGKLIARVEFLLTKHGCILPPVLRPGA